MKKKIRLIFLPFLAIAIVFILAYTFLNWLLFIETGALKIREDIVKVWLPLLLPFIAVFIWLRPRLNLLRLKRKDKDTSPGYYMIAAFAIAIPTIVAQHYIETATGKLTPLNSINDIGKYKPTKFYTLRRHYIEKQDPAINYTSNVSGKYNNDLNLYIYIACPVYDIEEAPAKVDPISQADSAGTDIKSSARLYILDGVQTDSVRVASIPPNEIKSVSVIKGNAATALYGNKAAPGVLIITTKTIQDPVVAPPVFARPIPEAWLCVMYQKTIRNRLSEEEKKNKYHEFSSESYKKFNDSNLESFTYVELVGNNSRHDGYRNAIAKSNSAADLSRIILLEPKYTSFESRNGNKLAWIFIALSIGALIFFLLLLIPEFKDNAAIETELKGSKNNDVGSFLKLFVPRKGYYVTPIIININILVFFIMMCAGLGVVSFDTIDLLKWGANYKPYTVNGEWWRLLTSTFLHAGIMHLVANMYGLLFVGIFLEPLLGKTKFLVCYLIAGLLASVTSLCWHTATVSVGASGAIFGLYGIFLVLLLTKVSPTGFNKIFVTGIFIFVGVNLLMGLTGGIDNAAHIGGLATGLIIGLILSPQLRRQEEDNRAAQIMNTSIND